ncbi:TonB-dependent receptor [uncultured Helicobacter sp.]|uniref:TonB-dependent receptor n=1 Tax=uncultured Helicobacter sp. TaxID=175537 RepID=UPI003753060C
MMKKFPRVYVIYSLLLCLGSSVVMYAKDTQRLLDSIITSSPLETDVSHIHGNISVIDTTEVRKSPNTKLTDTIKKLSGVRIQNDVGFNPRPKIVIRGINHGTLVMLDGVILSDLEGENRILNQISLYDVERIEVARGSFSSLYGTGAIGGVVNFITAMPKKFESNLVVGYGNELVRDSADTNLIKLYASVGDVFLQGGLRIKLSGGYTQSGGYASFPTYLAPNDTSLSSSGLGGYYTDKAGNHIIGTGGKRAYQTYDVRLKTEYDIGDRGMLWTMASVSNHTYDFGHFTSYLYDNITGQSTHLIGGKDYFVGSGLGGIGDYTHILGNLGYTHTFGADSVLKISLSSLNLLSTWQDANRDLGGDRFGGAGTTQDINSSSNYLDIVWNTRFLNIHSLTTALQFRYYTYTQKQRNMTNWRDSATRLDSFRGFGQRAFVGSGYVRLDSQWWENFSTNIGVRYDYWRNYGGYFFNNQAPEQNRDTMESTLSSISPKFGISWSIAPTWHISSSIGTGFRVPTLRDMYQFTHASNVWAINPNLTQERALSFEIGTQYRTQRLSTSAYYFHTELRDMIYRAGSGVQNNPWQYVNAGLGRIHGVELEGEIALSSYIFVGANYTFTNARILENSAMPYTEGKQLAGVPRHMSNITLKYLPKSGFYGVIWAYYAPAFFSNDTNSKPLTNTYGYYESQFSLNTKIGYVWRNGADLSLSGYNLTNNRYYDFYRVAGASVYMQLTYKL